VLVDREMVARYLDAGDPILVALEAAARAGDETFTSQRWLRDSAPKRLLYYDLYGDLLAGGRRLRVLDVGGGFTSLTRTLLEHHDYRLFDVIAHDDHRDLASLDASLGGFWSPQDWFELEDDVDWDIVIANDLFPNVDQRLAHFVERFLPLCRELRLSLTCYDGRRFYTTRRVDADEQLVVVAWDAHQTRRVLEPYTDRIDGDLSELGRGGESVFPNGRLVYLLRIRGDLA
jgi:hypothetical protein